MGIIQPAAAKQKTQGAIGPVNVVDPADPMGPQKKVAAEAAVNAFVKSGMNIGLGTGSTIKFGVDLVGQKLQKGQLKNIVAVATSVRTANQSRSFGIPVSDLKQTPKLDVDIDGADEVAKHGKQFFLIKGLGGALLREKNVASHAKKFVVVVDDGKLVPKLGTKAPLPVEVDKKAWQAVSKKLTAMGGVATLRQDPATKKPYVTDNGNFIVDVKWANGIDDPPKLARTLDVMRGVKAHGLFLNMADTVIVASKKGITTLTKNDAIPKDLFTMPLTNGAAAAAAKPGAAGREIQKLIEAAKTAKLPADVKTWLQTSLVKQAAIIDASLTMEAARDRVASGKVKLAPLDRTQLPHTEDEAVEFLMDRLQMTATERATIHAGLDALAAGGIPPPTRESIGGHTTKDNFRTQMAITDPGLDHIAETLADPRLLDGNWVHMEIINRLTEHMAPYSNPGYKTLALVRMLLGTSAPSTVFFGRPNYIASTLQDSVPGYDTASAGLKFNLPTAANWMANAARGVLNMGYSEAKFGMDGLSPEEVVTLGKAVHAQANLQEGEYISAAFNLNAVLHDFGLVPADAKPISGAPTPEQRALMLKGALQSVDAAKEGGFKKVTVDSASMTPPSYPLIEYFGSEDLLTWAHHAHELGLETYGSGGMRDYHFPLLELAGLDGVGVGFSIHDAPSADAPGVAGRLRTDKVASEVELRNKAEKTPVGRAATMLRMLDDRKSNGSITPAQDKLREDVFQFVKGIAHGVDIELDQLKATRDAAIAAAAKLPDAKKTAAGDAAKKTFEDAFQKLIATSLEDPKHAAAARKLLQQGAAQGVKP